MARRQQPEALIQEAVVQHLRARGAPGMVFLHCPNGGYRRPIEAAIFKAMGVRAGTADLLLWRGGNSYALELKAPGGRVSVSQFEFLADFDRAGGFSCVCDGIDNALLTLECWGLLIGRLT
jgi:hypothetical protein